jgi:hypothetical protein
VRSGKTSLGSGIESSLTSPDIARVDSGGRHPGDDGDFDVGV